MLEMKPYSFLLFIIHFVVSFCEKLYYLSVKVYEGCQHFLKKTILCENLSLDEPGIIDRAIKQLSKLPKHIVVLLKFDNNEPINYESLTNLIHWSSLAGVRYISFYDYQGKFLEISSEKCFLTGSHVSFS